MATLVGAMHSPRLRAMVVPREHGAWGMLLVPLATGALIAARTAIHGLALAFFVVAALALFWLRTPVEAWIGTSAVRVRNRQERKAVLWITVALSIVVVGAIGALFRLGYSQGLLWVGALAAVSFVLQALVKRLGRRGRTPSQIIGAVGLTSTAAGAHYVATGHLNLLAGSLWIANWLFACNQVHFVQLQIHAGRASSAREKFRRGYLFLIGQAALLIVIGVLIWLDIWPKLMMLAFLPAIFRGTAWFLRGPQPLDVHKLGFSELFQSILFGALLCMAFVV